MLPGTFRGNQPEHERYGQYLGKARWRGGKLCADGMNYCENYSHIGLMTTTATTIMLTYMDHVRNIEHAGTDRAERNEGIPMQIQSERAEAM